MGLPPEPLKAVFPIVLVRKMPKLTYWFLGTGFFISRDGEFLTAKHVLETADLAAGEEYNAAIIHGQDVSLYRISKLKHSDKFDIAWGRVEEVQNIQPLELATKNAPMNFDILTVEFSGTRSERLEDKMVMQFNPYFRKGNVICHYISHYPEQVPTTSLDLPFPALKGASGAPVLVENDGSVIGMIICNVERELLPAQVERIEIDQTHVEEIKYFLPNAKAISWSHLVEFVEAVRKTELI